MKRVIKELKEELHHQKELLNQLLQGRDKEYKYTSDRIKETELYIEELEDSIKKLS